MFLFIACLHHDYRLCCCKFTVVMSGAGNVEITYGNAVEIGIDMEFFGYSENTSYNTYTRIPFVIGTTYKVPNR